MPHALVVNKNSTNDYDVDVSRPSTLGNPFVGIGAIERFRAYLLNRPDLLAQVKMLRGKRIACVCAPKPCHADVIAEIANACEMCGGTGSFLHYPQSDHEEPCPKCQ